MSEYQYTLAEAFPEAPLPIQPFGSRVLVQLRTPPTKSKGGIVLTEYSREREEDIVQVGKILALGPVAFCNREHLTVWPEGKWCQPGDFVYVPRYGGDRWKVFTHDDAEIQYGLFNDLDLGGQILGDPLEVRTFFYCDVAR